jgi:hypothetical protein
VSYAGALIFGGPVIMPSGIGSFEKIANGFHVMFLR